MLQRIYFPFYSVLWQSFHSEMPEEQRKKKGGFRENSCQNTVHLDLSHYDLLFKMQFCKQLARIKCGLREKKTTNKSKNISHQSISISGSDASTVRSKVGLPEIVCHPQHCVTLLWCETRLGLAPASSS